MNRKILTGLVALVVLLAVNSLLLAGQPAYKPGVVLVRFANEPNVTAKGTILNSALGKSGSSVKHEYTLVKGLTRVSLPAGVSVDSAIASLNKSSSVLYAGPDYISHVFAVPNDALFGKLWGMHNTGQSGGTAGDDISATKAWDINTGSSSIIVAVTDTGVDYTHQDLAANMWKDPNGHFGYDFVNSDNDPMDDHGHGTHVSGTIGAVGNNSVGVAGVCWHVKIMAVKIADANGDISESDAVAGIEYAIANGARVINASWGYAPGVPLSDVQSLYDAVVAAQNAGVIFVAAAGNSNNNNDASPVYPASFDLGNVISVMATTDTDQRSSFSDYGLTTVDLGAPGGSGFGDAHDIYSTYPGNEYAYMAGTSMATPHVTGACALLLSIDPTLTYSDVKQILLSTVDSTLPGLCVSGGRLNLFAAAEQAATDTTPPTPNPSAWAVPPQATGLHTVTMQAVTATDRSGVEYYFQCVNDVNINSGWEANTIYTFTNLSAGTTYGFRVIARDKSSQHNQTGWSTTVFTTTASGTDTLPPFLSTPAWAISPQMIRAGTSPTVRMQAGTAYDESGVQYFFEETTGTGITSGWQSSPIYTVTSGLAANKTYAFQFEVRDNSTAHNTTSWSASASVRTATGFKILEVPAVYGTIQSAIDAAVDGDVVEISPYPTAPYTYNGSGNYNISFKGRAITVRSVDPTNPAVVASTVIDCQGTADPNNPRQAFIFDSNEEANSVLSGLTIMNGYVKGRPGADGSAGTTGSPDGTAGAAGGDAGGGAILCVASSPTINNCVIENCIAEGGNGGNGGNGLNNAPAKSGNGGDGGDSGLAYGGGIYADSKSSPIIQECTIISCRALSGVPGNGGNGGQNTTGSGGNGGNVAEVFGGGIFAYQNNIKIISCNITDCNALSESSPGQGGTGGDSGGVNGSSGSAGIGIGGGIYDEVKSNAIISSTNFSQDQANFGGAFCGLLDSNSTTVSMSDCNLTINEASYGGGIYLGGTGGGGIILRNCNITGDEAAEGGGACILDINKIEAYNAVVSGNAALYGGGVFLENLTLIGQDINFVSNSAQEGGAAFISGCDVNISSSNITGNSATMPQDSNLAGGLGGGLSLWQSYGQITNCVMNSNSAGAKGGAVFMEGYADSPLQLINCLITDNDAVYDGGALSNKTWAWTELINCTLVKNSATDGTNGSGGGVSCAEDWAWVEIINSILWDNFAEYGPQIGVGTKFGSSNDPSADVDVSYSDVQGGEDEVFIEEADVTDVWWLDGSFDADPLFTNIAANQTAYYLSQLAAGQLKDSPCMDAGEPSITVAYLESMVGFPLTTRTDLVEDANVIDIGYHYPSGTAGTYSLTIEVYVYDPNSGGHGRLNASTTPQDSAQIDINDTNTIQVNQGTVVDLTAFNIDPGYVVESWSGTDSDSSTAVTNTVTMTSSKTVMVAFEPNGMYYLTVTVVGNGTVTPSGKTLHVSGEVVTLTATPATPQSTVIWTGTNNDNSAAQTNTVTMTGNKNVTVEFYTPKILYVGGDSDYSTIQTAINEANDRDIVMLMPSSQPYYTQAGYTINGKNITITSTNPDDPNVVASTIIEQAAGANGGVGNAFTFENVGPLMRLQGITIRGFYGTGGAGLNGDPSKGYYDGRYGSTVPAMGIECSDNASPTIINCVIDNCHSYGGNGGNGASGDSTHINGGNGGWPGGAWGGGLYCSDNSNPMLINCTFSNNTAIGGNGGNGGAGSTTPFGDGGRGGGWYYGYDIPSPWESGAYRGGLPKDWSGLGGAVYVGSVCYPTFESCTFIDNFSSGGLNGICGADGIGLIVEPSISYKIPNLGGAVYIAEDGYADFNNCTFTTNVADTNRVPASYDGFLGYGGAIAMDDYATAVVSDCNFVSNSSDIGGGAYSSVAYSKFDDCNFSDNNATHGGGLLLADSIAYIMSSTFSGNVGIISGSEGGAISLLGTNAEVTDCNITNNQTGGSGGGVYISSQDINGEEVDGGNSVLIKNCLITNNSAALGGGGIFATWYSEPNIVNCTIFNNSGSSGGGLVSSYGSYVNVLNSIIWGNTASVGSNGSQIAISGGGDVPSSIQVLYSDVQDANDPCAWTTDINTLDFVICFDTTGSMGGDINAVSTSAGRIINAIASQYPDYRVGLVDFRDYPDGVHGDTGDWPYLDRVAFTTDANKLVNGLGAMAAGGGADNPEAIYAALMHCIDANALVARLTANGYTNYIESASPGLGNWRQGRKVMRVILLLTDAPPHDPEPYTNYVLSDIVTAAGGQNPIHIIPVVIRGDANAENALRPVAVGTGGMLIPATDDNAVTSAVLNAIGLLSQIPTPISVTSGSIINWDPNTFSWGLNSNNINADPLFINGFFLSQIAAGQLVNSPCVDAGNADVNSSGINLGGYTTRTDGVADMCTVDIGYHYPPFIPTQYYLNFTAVDGNGLGPNNISPGSGYFTWYETVPLQITIPVPAGIQVLWTGTDNDEINGVNNSVIMNGNRAVTVAFVRNTCNLTVNVVGSGTVTPMSGTYSRGTVVTLTATPASGYRIESWQGTDDDSSYAQTNSVTMSGSKTVTVTFSLPQTLTVPGQYSSIQDAIEAARSGDIVSVASGVYNGSDIVINKEVTIASSNPDDPCVVAATVISSNGYADRAVVFGSGATANSVLDGFTITSGTYYVLASTAPTGTGQNGVDGGSISGGAMYIGSGASPTIRNCVIRDTNITGGNASSGTTGDSNHLSGRGGWAGGSYGGGIFVDSGASPTFINCTVTNCSAIGGNAGNGGASTGTYGTTSYVDANHGGSWSDANTFPYQSLVDSNGQPYYYDYEFYSGLGGGVFCYANSTTTFIDCNITNNTASGGMSGIGGDRPWTRPDPVTAYRIPSYGGGVFCAPNATVYLINCNVTGNISPKPDATYHIDPYLGHGGGIAEVNSANVQVENCTISGNIASVGGGVFWIGGSPAVLDCNIINNVAYLGGGIYGADSSGQIKDCSMSSNFAGVLSSDVDVVAGQGGGIFGSSMSADIIDCFLTNNKASASGAGIYVYGPALSDTIIRNCLLTNNQSGRDGGGISVNWGVVAVVENCTLYNNLVTGDYGVYGNTGFGGGLYCSYEASTDVNNCIFWDDNSLSGSEIYVGPDTNHEPTCGSVVITFSDIQGGQADVCVGNSCPLTWGTGNMNTNPQFVSASGGDFHLANTTAGQKVNSPCIDAGGNPAQLEGLFKYSTSTLGTPDMGVVDIGYHYPIADYCRRWDLLLDNTVNFQDLAIFALSWVGAIGSESNGYNINDLADFTDCWLVELSKDVTPPTPNPMQWLIAPRVATGVANAVEMEAVIASDASGTVYYQFEDVNGTPSAWQVDPCYMVTGLSSTGEHCFRVRAKDKYNNTTDWSDFNSQTGVGCVTNIGDVCKPSPAPTMIVSANPSGVGDDNSSSEQYQWSATALDWWHKIVVNVSGITDNVTPTSNLEVRFICSDSSFSSDNVIPAKYLPIRIGYPVSIGGRIPNGVGVQSGSYMLTWNGTDEIVYDVFVGSYGGAIGVKLNWYVCVYDAAGNADCSATYQIPQD